MTNHTIRLVKRLHGRRELIEQSKQEKQKKKRRRRRRRRRRCFRMDPRNELIFPVNINASPDFFIYFLNLNFDFFFILRIDMYLATKILWTSNVLFDHLFQV